MGKMWTPHQILIFVKEKYEFVYCQLCFGGLLAPDDHFSKIYLHIWELGASDNQ